MSAAKKAPQPSQIEKMPGLTPRDFFFFQLGQTMHSAVNERLAHCRFTLAAPDEEARLLGEVAIELMMEKVGGTAASRLSENIVIQVGGKSGIRDATVKAKPPKRPRYLH